jgi:hypothetical protein
MELTQPVKFCISCIDRRFNYLSIDYFNKLGFTNNFYEAATAGAGLCAGFSDYCSTTCGCPSCDTETACDPSNIDMEVLKNSLITNINIAQTLNTIDQIYILNHQDCGAIRAYLECSGYPSLGENNQLEIDINRELLQYAHSYMMAQFPHIDCRIGLQDINGTVHDFNIETQEWVFQQRGEGNEMKGLWYVAPEPSLVTQRSFSFGGSSGSSAPKPWMNTWITNRKRLSRRN